jgi:acetate CoA/acetoacetate CoA-transferase alpha subunit
MNKVKTIPEAVTRIKDGDSLMIGGFMTVGTPEHLVDAVLAAHLKDLTIICNDAGTPGKGAGKIVDAGIIKKYITNHIGLNPVCGKLMSNGELDVTLIPQGTMAERIRAGGAGLGGFLTPTGLGTVVEEGKQIINIEDKDYLLELPLKADVALIKAHRADRSGNLIFRKSAQNFNPLMATACKYVIAEVEHIEDVGCLDPDAIMLSGIFIDVIVQG